MRRKLFSAAALVSTIGLALFIYGFPTPSSKTKDTGNQIDTTGLNLIDQASFEVATGEYYVRNITLNQNISILASVQIGFGSESPSRPYRCINFYIMDDGNYVTWLKTGNASKYVSKRVDLSETFRFNAQNAGVFYFIFDNKEMCSKFVTFELFDITGSNMSVNGGETGQLIDEGSRSLKRLSGASGAAMLTVGLLLMAYVSIQEPHPKQEGIGVENAPTNVMHA